MRLSEFVTIRKGKKPSIIYDKPVAGGVRFLQIEDLRSNNELKFCKSDSGQVIVSSDHVLIAWDGANAGTVGFGLDGAIGSTIAALQFDSKTMLPSYLGFFLRANFEYLRANATGATIPHLTRDSLLSLDIPVRSFNEQISISKRLSKITEVLQMRALTICQFDSYLRSLFIEVFGDPTTNPKGWSMDELGMHTEVLTDYHANGSYETLRKHVELQKEKNYALMVRTTDLENNEFEKDVNYITKEAYDFLKKSVVFGGEIIINKIGSAGNVYLMPHLNRPVSLGMNAFMLRFKNTLNSNYVYQVLTSEYGKSIIMRHVKGAVTKTITKDAVRSLIIPVPPIQIQNAFVDKVNQLQKLRIGLVKSQEDMNYLFTSLLSEAFK